MDIVPKNLKFYANLFFYHNNLKLQVHTNYKLHEMKKAKTRLNFTYRLK